MSYAVERQIISNLMFENTARRPGDPPAWTPRFGFARLDVDRDDFKEGERNAFMEIASDEGARVAATSARGRVVTSFDGANPLPSGNPRPVYLKEDPADPASPDALVAGPLVEYPGVLLVTYLLAGGQGSRAAREIADRLIDWLFERRLDETGAAPGPGSAVKIEFGAYGRAPRIAAMESQSPWLVTTIEAPFRRLEVKAGQA